MHNIEHVDYSNYAVIMDDVKRYNVISKPVMLGSASSNYTCMMPKIKDVKFHDQATIVFWEDGTKTVVKCGNNDIFDPEKGLAIAIAKRALGNQGNYYNEIRKWTEGYFQEDYVNKYETNKDSSLYNIFAHKSSYRMHSIDIPYHKGMLHGYFNNDLRQWIYTPDICFMKYNLPASDNDQRIIVTAIKNICEYNLAEYTNEKITVDVNFCTNYKDPDHPYTYTVNLNYHK